MKTDIVITSYIEEKTIKKRTFPTILFIAIQIVFLGLLADLVIKRTKL